MNRRDSEDFEYEETGCYGAYSFRPRDRDAPNRTVGQIASNMGYVLGLVFVAVVLIYGIGMLLGVW